MLFRVFASGFLVFVLPCLASAAACGDDSPSDPAPLSLDITEREQLQRGKHTLRVEIADEPLFLDADPTRLAQVISNLLNTRASTPPPAASSSCPRSAKATSR